ncbi:MAG: DUF3082 domain-containing protein [Prochlorotrichaceae cyanobacterium]
MTETPSSPEITSGRCLTGSLISGGFGFLLYQLTTSIATTFAAKPIVQKSYLATNIGIAVRTLVVGACSLATFIFIMAAVGLFLLGLQTAFRKVKNEG